MFTGLIEQVCRVMSVRRNAGGMLLTIDLEKLADETKIGDSIAINGACLTVAGLTDRLATFDLSAETLAKSALGRLKPTSEVNVERAIKAADRLGGHFVQGHNDNVATIKQIDKKDRFANMKFAADPELLDQMIIKGSAAVDGISLTIADLDRTSFSAAIIPQTLKKTTLDKAKIGDEVNVETDILTKIMQKLLEKSLSQKQGLTIEKLKQLGF